MNVKIKLVHPDAKMPTRADPGSSGFDLYAVEECWISPGEVTIVPTGLQMEIPPGYEVQIRPRSGLAAKSGIIVVNSPGTVDFSFRGEVKVIMSKLSDDHSDDYYHVLPGTRIAQMVIQQIPDVGIELTTDELSETSRGAGGFGSSGV
jgi:dUTP pyrophosphatase